MVPRFSCTWRGCHQLAITLAALLALALPAHAQVVGQIQGTVTDAQGAVLPGVSLTLRNTENGAARTAVSEGDGQYRFAGLQPGTYALKAELQGFANVDVERLTINIGVQLQQDIKMQLQSLQETVPPPTAIALLSQCDADAGDGQRRCSDRGSQTPS